MAAGQPGPVQWTIGLASMFAGRGVASAIVLAILLAVIGIAVYLNWQRNVFLLVGSLLGLLIWITGEYFGGVFTGSGTDPNSGPLLVLLAATLWVASRPPIGSSVTKGLRSD
jgi:hypothetical protein